MERSGSILKQLDLALQSYRNSNYANVSENAIADFKTVLDVTVHELSQAFEAISTGEIELRLDTNILAYGTGASRSPMVPSSSSNATDSAHDRKSSCTSSAWSLVPRDNFSQESASDSMSVRSESKTERLPSDENQLYDFDGIHVQTSSAVNSAAGPKPSLDWRSPFASLDPLSISIEEASAMILADDDEIVSNTIRSRSGTGSTVFVDGASNEGPQFAERATTPSAGEEPAMSTSTLTLHPVQDSGAPPESNVSHDSKDDTSGESHVPEQSDTQQAPEQSTLTPFLSSTTEGDANLLSPNSAATGFARRKRNSSISSINAADQPQETSVGQGNGEEAENNLSATSITEESPSDHLLAVPTDTASEASTDSEEPRENMGILTLNNTGDIVPPIQIPPPSPGFDAGPPDSGNVTAKANHAPSMPTRLPPPPPKPRRSSGTKRVSSYRIVNASPLDSESSDDELYTTSKPASPTTQTRTRPRSNTFTVIPKVSIDASACEDDTAVGLGIRDADSISKTFEGDVSTPGAEQTGMEILASALRSKFNTAETPVSTSAQRGDTSPDPHPIERSKHASIPRRHSVAVPPSQDAPVDEAPALPPRRPPPPIPKRPERTRYNRRVRDQDARPAPPTVQTSPAALDPGQETHVEEKELTAESGLEVQQKLGVSAQPPRLRERVSVDAALNVGALSSLPQTASGLEETTRHSRSVSVPQVDTTTSNLDPAFAGFYGPGIDSTSDTQLERERISHIIHFWNDGSWDQAEAYLSDYLTVLMQGLDLARARRVRHLLGVCVSFKGEWLRAIPLFLFVLRAPIRDIADIDDGDCAAAYWLGDIYSLLNRRTEALLAYCIAERSSLFNDAMHPALGELITSEQEAVQLGQPKTDSSTRLAQVFSVSAANSILDPSVVNTATAMKLFENNAGKVRREVTAPGMEPFMFKLNQNTARSQALFKLDNDRANPWTERFFRMKLNTAHFEPNTPWPMMYDPGFNMANVQRGRLLAYECDLLAVYTTNLEAKIPKSGPLGLGRMDCFTCSDLTWLIRTIRECLKVLEMEFSEVANVEGTWFVVRYTVYMQNKVATTHYFSIALFKQTLRNGYGAEICPDGICSARIGRTNIDHDKGVHISESKRIKRLVRDYLDEAAKQRPKSKRKDSASNTAQGGTNAAEQPGTPPPIPPRPSV